MRFSRLVTIILCLGLVVQVVGFTGLIASDDLGYVRYAARIAGGEFVPELHHYAFRYGLTLPMAGVFWLSGVSETSMVVVPWVASMVAIATVMWIARRLGGVGAAVVAGVLYATFPLQAHHASMVVPEPVAEMFVLLAVARYLIARERNGLAAGVLPGLLLGCGFLAKEPVFFVALALGLHALGERRFALFGGLVAGAALPGAAELIYHTVAAGDPLLRLHGGAAHEASPMAVIANQDLSYRLFREYPGMMLRPGDQLGYHSLLALACAPFGWWASRNGLRALFALWTVLPWLYINFGSSSFDHYFALPVAWRYIEFAYPPLFVMTGILFGHLWSRGGLWRVAVGTVLGAVAGYGVYGAQRWARTVPLIDTVSQMRQLVDTLPADVRTVRVEQPPERAGNQVERRWARTWRILAPGVQVRDRDPVDGVIRVGADGTVRLIQ